MPLAPAGGAAAGAAVAGPVGAVVGLLAAPYVRDLVTDQESASINQAEQQALASGQPVSWQAQGGRVRGTVEPTRTYTNAQGQLCRDFRERIQLPDRTVTPSGTACRGVDGNWRTTST